MRYYLLVLIILLIGINIHQGSEYEIFDIEKCYGTAEVKVRLKFNKTMDYAIKDCNYDGEIWNCVCKPGGPTHIIMQTRDSAFNSYYIVLQYQITPLINDATEDDNNKRVYNFNNIIVGYFPEEKPKPPFKFNTVAVIVVLLIVAILLGGLTLLFVYLYKIFKTDEEKANISEIEYRELSKKWKTKNEQELTDEDNTLIDKYRKV